MNPVAPGEWCETCDAYVPTESLQAGMCPTCGEALRDSKAPWHFKLLIFALVVYLGFRAIQMIIWLLHRF